MCRLGRKTELERAMTSDFEKTIRAQIDQVEVQRARLQSDLARVDGQLVGLRQALSLFLGDVPMSNAQSRERPSGQRGSRVPDPAKNPSWAFVLATLEGAPPSGMSVDEIEQRGEHAGFPINHNTLLANLSNGTKEGIVQRVSVGRYRRDRERPDEGLRSERPALDEPEPSDPTPLLSSGTNGRSQADWQS
jgi:hypothetical protein